MPEITIYALLLVATVILAVRGGEDAQLMSCALAFAWVVSNIAWQADAMRAAFAADLALACFTFWAFRSNRNGWRLPFLGLCILQLTMDAVYDCFGDKFYEPWARASNAVFVLQLIAIGWEGGTNVWGGLLDRIRNLRLVRRLQAACRQRLEHD